MTTPSIISDFTAFNSSGDQVYSWLLDMDQIQPGHSAILNNNTIIFYGVHYTGLVTILISLISCISVIISVCRINCKKRANWDFSDRFPMYLAFSDLLWGIVNLSTDHVILVVRQTYPERKIATMLAINVFLFFGYQQLMSAGLSLYTYLKVVRRISLDLGRWEWKLHASVVSFLVLNVSVNAYLGALGNSGFWFLVDLKVFWGKVFGINVCTTATVHAILTLTAYRSIQNVINNQKRVVLMHIPVGSDGSTDFEKMEEHSDAKSKSALKHQGPCLQSRYHSTATNCLTTFVYISLCVYTPLAVTTWVYCVFGFLGYIEPTTTLLIVLLANSGGWVNAWGYFHNRKLKEKRRNTMLII